ncbi:hypothetical protein OU798_16275 [Prolixibacteraceae bacterium Z1-6]|uniref:Uncharacterized protein n=1 Tax=Draconibacterium aestuarii TaxID=2998507 RepID=A0A9X3F8S6_9BACT|nr:hypothetical protein [Prolixibacteraceae bacterium Z1-6]
MKKIILMITGLVFFTIQVFAQDTNKDNNPDEQIIVNKQYDENGNLIQYDSTYVHQWSSSDSTFQFLFPDDPFFSKQGFPDIEQFFEDFQGDSVWGFMPDIPDINEMLQRFQNQLQVDPDSIFNRRSLKFHSFEQQKEWQQLMEKHRKEMEDFKKKWDHK